MSTLEQQLVDVFEQKANRSQLFTKQALVQQTDGSHTLFLGFGINLSADVDFNLIGKQLCDQISPIFKKVIQ